MTPIVRTLALALVLGALLPAAAHANANQISIMMDDDRLVYRDDRTAAAALSTMQTLGVDTVRVTLLWSVAAENAFFTKTDLAKLKGKKLAKARQAALRQNRRFKASDPRTYPIRNWDRYDNLVRSAGNYGIKIYFNVTGPGPAWAHEKPPKKLSRFRKTWKPRASAFKRFVQAVGRRFDGTYRDENGGRAVIPRVSFWSLWNEPNQGGWLTPQWERNRNGRYTPASPAIYRRLHQAGYKGLLATGHRVDNDVILMGETAPLGSDRPNEKAAMRPGLFLKELACVKADGTPYTGNRSAARDCGALAQPLPANGYAHHPYTKNISPLVRDPNPDSITMANITELGGLLDLLSAKTNGAIPTGMPLFMTEFGFETNPPDPFNGVTPALQAKYNTIGEYQAWANPRIASQAQFLLLDVPPVARRTPGTKSYWFTYQSGLFLSNGTAKPAAAAYTMPLLVTPSGAAEEGTGNPIYTFWGQVRFLPNTRTDTIQLQWRPKGAADDAWVAVGDPVTLEPRGYFTAARAAPAVTPGEWRAVWTDGTAATASLTLDGT